MYISSFHVDGFGILSDVTVEDLCPGINIFFGRNEAGKTTCLEFLRAMLAGYPEDLDFREKYKPLSQERAGGSLLLNCEIVDGSVEKIRLTRRPSPADGLILQDADGNPVALEYLGDIFSGISPEVYRKVFGFSPGELESFESLSAEGVAEALYGASFGPGLLSPALALEELERRKDRILKASGQDSSLNAALAQLGELRNLISRKESEMGSYEQQCLIRDRHKESLARLQEERNELEAKLRILQRRLSIWRQWDQWREIKHRLEHMGPIPAAFPEEALRKLTEMRTARNEREMELAALRKKLDSLRERRDGLVFNTPLVEMLPALRSLAERKGGYRQALNVLDGQAQRLDRAREELADTLSRLGSDWDCERIRATNRSLFARENLARHEEEIHNAQLACQTARDSLENASHEVESCEKALISANGTLLQFPQPEEIMSASEKDELRELMGSLTESRRLEQTRETAYKSALEAFEKALSQAKIAIDAEGSDILKEASSILKNIDSRQEEARRLSNELLSRQAEIEVIKQKSARLEENAENIRIKAEANIAQTQKNHASSRDALEMKSRALRSLRALSSQISVGRERLEDLEARIGSASQPARTINKTLLAMAVLLILGGGGFFIANYFWGLVEISIANGPSLVINLWMCCLALVCGVILLAFGFPANGDEKRRYHQEMAQLQASRENSMQRLAEYDEQARQLLEAAGVDSMDPITLDAAEMLLEREKEQCIHEERSQRDAENLQRELTAIRMQLTALQRDAHEKEREIQQCRRNWLSLMESLHITDCPSPESLSTVFARMEAAGIALGNVQATNQELEDLWEELHLLESSIGDMPAIQRKLQSASEPLSLEEAVSQTLEACNAADIAREQRNMALAAVKTMEEELAGARRRKEEAALRLDTASRKLEELRGDWAASIAGFGLGENMDPRILREALLLMDQALLAEEKLAGLEQETRRAEKEKLIFETGLTELLTQLGREEAEMSDRLLQLDSLLDEAGKALDIQNEQKRLTSLVSEQEAEYAAREAALETGAARLRELLLQGEADNEDDFTRTARLVEEKRRMEEERDRLESSLALSAGTEPLEQFLQGFQAESHDDQERNLTDYERNLAELNDRIEEEARILGNMEGQLESMAADDSLSRLRQEEALLRATVENRSREWVKAALAESILLKARHKFEKERQPEVIRIASDIFSRITDGRWRGLKSSLENAQLEILSDQGQSLPPHALSRGAQEQAYLALRLAYINEHARNAIPLPLMMDEILVNFDPGRAEHTARTLAELVQNSPLGKAQQILYFTCHPHIVTLLRDAAPDSRLFEVEKGHIRAA